MIDIDKIELAAKRLRNAEMTKIPCAPVRDILGEKDLESAYEVQKKNTQIRLKSGGRVIGHKIGLTAPIVQKQLGVDQPDFGLLWHDKEVFSGDKISISKLMQPKAEAEIAFVLGSGLDKKYLTSGDVLNAVEYVVPSIEIVGSRIRNWDIKITDTIADNASASHWVLGYMPMKLHEIDLINCKMQMKIDGKIVSEGQGSDCLGSPINALLWLAQKMVNLDSPLKRGDLILSGALGPMIDVTEGDQIDVKIEGLGSVSVSFTA
ncbi:MAG: fumarylacetoacetate hydrolase family protein [Saprospiraceae bacterium]